jgi:hypothetical protein
MRAKPEWWSRQVLRLTYAYNPETGDVWFLHSGERLTPTYGRAGRGAGYVRLGQQTVTMNKLIWKWCFDTDPYAIIPRDDNPANHRLANLKAVSAFELHSLLGRRARRGEKREAQAQNIGGKTARSHSGVNGVHRHVIHGNERWIARGQKDGKQITIGTYLTMDECVAARQAWARGEPALTSTATRDSGAKKRRGTGSSGAAGVRTTPSGGWQAAGVKRNGKTPYLGSFATKEEAIAARKKWEDENGAA